MEALVILICAYIVIGLLLKTYDKGSRQLTGTLRSQDPPITSKNSPTPQTKSNPYGIHLPPPKNAEAAREASRAQTPGYKPPPSLSQPDKEQIYVIIRNSLYENGILKGSNDYSLQQGRYAAIISEISKEVVEYINNTLGEK